jgi:torulene dioxygenase
MATFVNDAHGTNDEGKDTAKHFKDWPNDKGFGDIPETRTPIELKVTGTIPNYVRGALYRTGPGSYTVPMNNGKTFKIQHWYHTSQKDT